MGLENFGIAGGPAKKASKSSKKSSKGKQPSKDEEDIDSEPLEAEQDASLKESSIEESENNAPSLSMASKKKKLRCTKAKCGYTRTLFKRELEPNDYICPKCGGEMKLSK